jgi:hypothetical protein
MIWLPLAIMNRNLAKLTQNSYFSYDFFFFKKQGIMWQNSLSNFYFFLQQCKISHATNQHILYVMVDLDHVKWAFMIHTT